MTRLWIMSDIHDDSNRDTLKHNLSLPEDVSADVCIIAGDIAGRLSRMGRTWLEHQFRQMPIVIVPGNHDFWKADLLEEVDKFRESLQVDWIYCLDGDAITLAGTRFVGGTLWTDYLVSGNSAAAKREHLTGMRDFKRFKIGGAGGKARPSDLEKEHWRIRNAIDQELAVPFEGPSVVVTHHAPHPLSLREGRVTEDLDGAYTSDLTELITRRAPEMWIHGHVHTPRDYVVVETRIVCNPRGYLQFVGMEHHKLVEIEVPSFDPRLVIDVQRRPRIDPWGYPMPYDDEVALWRQNQALAAMTDEELLDVNFATGRKV
ncbi:metallophosphoesterase [Aureimonas glaciei]|uniref:Serine/threonine protein phosphatase n=1 Tax=Aureimonas glaciei TaxID=1776957 RepID=A0A916YBU8_9HYPH|nr:metallophosphoesterase [Aureimonas glaciei]GGD38334.1 serine/threonine protein phosphatase [Aureimonas glaciei]